MVVKMSGLGVTATSVPLGDVARESVAPVVPIEAFVGGRKARMLSVELSRTEVGVFEVRFEVPQIAPDLHDLSVTVGGISLAAGRLIVTPHRRPRRKGAP